MKVSNIFRDRRVNSSAPSKQTPQACRRTETSSSDEQPWWLQVNYLTRQLVVIENNYCPLNIRCSDSQSGHASIKQPDQQD